MPAGKIHKHKPKVQEVKIVRSHPRRGKRTKLVMLRCPFRRGSALFPDKYRTTGHMVFNQDVEVTGTVSTVAYYELILNANNPLANNMATKSNRGTETISTQVCAGLTYLVGDPGTGTGGTGPYTTVRVHGTRIKATYLPFQTSGVNTGFTVLTVIPMNFDPNTYFATMPYQTAQEQPYAKSKYIPVTYTSPPKGINHKMTTLQIYGDKYKSSIENGEFDAKILTSTTFSSASNPYYWYVQLATLNNGVLSYTLSGHLSIEVWYDLEFMDRTVYNSAAPS